MTDWCVGDLAVCISDVSLCGECEDGSNTVGKIFKVLGIDPCPGQKFVGLMMDDDDPRPSCACAFRKVVKDAHEACEAEFVTLLKRTKRKVEA